MIAFGFLANAAAVGLYVLIARTNPTDLRATGTGADIEFDRIGAALGPCVAGQLLAVGVDRLAISLAVGFGSAVGAMVLQGFVHGAGERNAS